MIELSSVGIMIINDIKKKIEVTHYGSGLLAASHAIFGSVKIVLISPLWRCIWGSLEEILKIPQKTFQYQ